MAHVQGLFAKRGTCPTRADINAAGNGCVGRCALSWLVNYDTYTGHVKYSQQTTLATGFAPLGAEKEAADWYIGVESLNAAPAEFSISLSSRPRTRQVAAYACGRLSHFCPTEVLNLDNASILLDGTASLTSAAVRGTRTSAPTLGLTMLLGSVFARMLRPRRRTAN